MAELALAPAHNRYGFRRSYHTVFRLGFLLGESLIDSWPGSSGNGAPYNK
jgi:hypothetical protein